MTVVVQTPFNQHTGNGVTTLFGFTFQLLAAGDLEVSLDGVVQPSGFTISGLGVQAGGSVTFAVAPASGVVVDIRRRIPLARSTDYQLNGDLPSDQIDLDFDRLWQAKQDAEFNAGLTVQVPLGDTAAPVILPDVTTRASRFLAFDGSGHPIAANTLDTGVPVSAFMETMLDDANAAAARSTLGLGSVATENVTPISKGGTGQTSAAAALAALGVSDGQLAQPGDFKFHFGSSAPSGWLKANGGTIGSASSGATLRANADTISLYTLLWNDYSQALLPIQTSAGGASTRGASAAADFAANKRLPVPDLRGEFIRGWSDGSSVDSGRAFGSSQSHAYQQHSHGYSVGVGGTGGANPSYSPAGATSGDTANTALSGSPNTETRPRNIALLACIKF